MFVPLSFGEDGCAFEVPEPRDSDTSPAGWLVLKKPPEGRGRPAVVHHRNGKPMIIPLDASHEDLFAQAGNGRYRLQPVDRYGRKLEGIPTAHTGMLTAYPAGEDDELSGDPEMVEGFDGASTALGTPLARRPGGLEGLVVHVVTQNTSALQQMTGQFVAVMQAHTQLLQIVTNSAAMNLAAAAPAAEPVREPAPQPASDPSIIKQVIDSIMPHLMARFGAGAMLGGLSPAIVASAPPAPSVAPSAPPAAPSAPPAAPSAPAQSAAQTAPSPAGAAPSDPTPGAVPAESWAETQARIGMHLQQVLGALSAQEQAHAAMLIGRLDEPTREALLRELLTLTVPEAIERARAILRSQSEGPSTPAPATPPPSGT